MHILVTNDDGVTEPGIAFSLAAREKDEVFFFDTASEAARSVVTTIVDYGLVPDMLLNVNVPNIPLSELRGYRVTRQGMRVYDAVLDRRLDPRGQPYYWIGGKLPSGIPDEGTDIGAIAEGYVSITPLQLDMTEYRRTRQLSMLPWGEGMTVGENGRVA